MAAQFEKEIVLARRPAHGAKSFSHTAAICPSKRGAWRHDSRRASAGSARGTGRPLRSTLPLGKRRQVGKTSIRAAPCRRASRARSLADRPSSSERAGAPRDDVAHQLLEAGKSSRNATAAAFTSGTFHQHRFDLRKLDAEAANLHLSVNPPEKLDFPVGCPTGQVAGPVKPPGRAAVCAPRR